MTCPTDLQTMFRNGDFMDSIICFLTANGDPTLMVLVPTAIYGSVLLAMFIFAQSALIPIVISIILAGVLFVAFPSGAVTVVLLAMLFLIAAAGQALTWRMGR